MTDVIEQLAKALAEHSPVYAYESSDVRGCACGVRPENHARHVARKLAPIVAEDLAGRFEAAYDPVTPYVEASAGVNAGLRRAQRIAREAYR